MSPAATGTGLGVLIVLISMTSRAAVSAVLTRGLLLSSLLILGAGLRPTTSG